MGLGEVSRAGVRCNRHCKTSPVELDWSAGLVWPRNGPTSSLCVCMGLRICFVASYVGAVYTRKFKNKFKYKTATVTSYGKVTVSLR